MVVSDVSMLDVPPLRGNPFDLRPIERSRAEDIVARDEILTAWREHMLSQSPRMLLIVGERGSGRTSLINALSSQTTRHFVGQYWHEEDPLKRVLSEISVTFGGHEVPQTMHQTVERLVETLDIEDGPLPLIALDYPSNVDITPFLTLIAPILQRLRALVVVALTNAQLAALEEPVQDLFDKPVHLEPLTSRQIQSLADNRVRRMAREKWPIHPRLLDSVRASTGGNPRAVIRLLRDLIDEKRGTGAVGTFERLLGWDAPFEPEPVQAATVETEIEEQYEPLGEPQLPVSVEEDELEDDWDVEPDDMWEDEGPESEEEAEPDTEPREEDEEDDVQPAEQGATEPSIITDWAPEKGGFVLMEEGTEPPPKQTRPGPPPKQTRPGGFSGLMGRSRQVSDHMPTGADDTPIMESQPPSPPSIPPTDFEPEPADPPKQWTAPKSIDTSAVPIAERPVFATKGELWTVDSDLEETLPKTPDDSPEPEAFDTLEPAFEEEFSSESGIVEDAPPTSAPVSIGPRWESADALNEAHLGSMSDAERLVVSFAGQREISPSDPEIQARLEVGRPRLSQIYNALQRSGILSVRKEGRSRLFKLSDAAAEMLP